METSAAAAAATSPPRPFCLRECRNVSVCDLSGVERFVVWAIRWRSSSDRGDSFATSCLEDSFDRAGLQAAQPAFEGFVEAACPMGLVCSASQRLGCWKLSELEAHALHALACIQSGLLGEAYHTLARIVVKREVGRALEHLEELAGALDRIGGRIERWRLEDGRPLSRATA